MDNNDRFLVPKFRVLNSVSRCLNTELGHCTLVSFCEYGNPKSKVRMWL